MATYYNEFDPHAAEWLRNLIAAGLIAGGDVDERDIREVQADDLRGYVQCHFFAGIGGWSHALRLAGWPDDEPVTTGSCPCQPFSSAGKRKGTDDERHLWPEFRRLISECRPSVVFGEQVASKFGRQWLGGDARLQRLLDREAVVGVLQRQDFLGRLSDEVQGLLSISRACAQGKNPCGEALGGSPTVAPPEPRCSTSESRGLSGQATRSAVRAQPVYHPEDHRTRRMSVDGYTLQPRWRPVLGQPVSGSDRQQQGVHTGEHTGSAVLHQRNGKYLGRKQNCRDCQRHYGGEAQSLGRLADAPGVRIEAATEHDDLAGVRADLEDLGYAVGAADLCAASCGAPHIRQRLFWVADALPAGRAEGWAGAGNGSSAGCGASRGLADDASQGRAEQPGRHGRENGRPAEEPGRLRDAGRLGFAEGQRRHYGSDDTDAAERGQIEAGTPGTDGGGNFWSDSILIPCSDGRARRTQPGLQPLVDGLPFRLADGRTVEGASRAKLLMGIGNAIVPQVAAEFIKVFMECRP